MNQNPSSPQQQASPNQKPLSIKPQQEITCRICLQDMLLQQTFVVCLCKGANAHVHQKCLLQWSKKAQKYRQSFDDYFYNCEICTKKIYLKVQKELKCIRFQQISFFGQQLCCTVSSIAILLLGLGMFAASLYLRLASNEGSRYLFDIALACAVIIVVLNVVISGFYFVIQTDITVIGIVIRNYEKVNKQTITNISHRQSIIIPHVIQTSVNKQQTVQANNTKRKFQKKGNNTIRNNINDEMNVTQMNLLQNGQNNSNHKTQMLEDIGFQERLSEQYIKNDDQFQSQSINQLKVHCHKRSVDHLKQKQHQRLQHQNKLASGLEGQNKFVAENQTQQKINCYMKSIITSDSVVYYETENLAKTMKENNNVDKLVQNHNADDNKNDKQNKQLFQESNINPLQSFIVGQVQKIQQTSLTSVQQHSTNSIQVRSILCRSRKSYETDIDNSQQPSLYFVQKNQSMTSQIFIESDISHNQIASLSKGVTIKNDRVHSNVHKYRKTEPGYLGGFKKSMSVEIGEQVQHQNQNQLQNVEIYYPKI